MTVHVHLFGTTVTPTYPADPAAVGMTIQIGDDLRRPPIVFREAVTRVANSEAVTLTDDHRVQLDQLGVEIQDATGDVKKREAYRLLATGMDRDSVNSEIAKMPTVWRTTKPVKILAAFRPVDQNAGRPALVSTTTARRKPEPVNILSYK